MGIALENRLQIDLTTINCITKETAVNMILRDTFGNINPAVFYE
jgi:hypothetical protein